LQSGLRGKKDFFLWFARIDKSIQTMPLFTTVNQKKFPSISTV